MAHGRQRGCPVHAVLAEGSDAVACASDNRSVYLKNQDRLWRFVFHSAAELPAAEGAAEAAAAALYDTDLAPLAEGPAGGCCLFVAAPAGDPSGGAAGVGLFCGLARRAAAAGAAACGRSGDVLHGALLEVGEEGVRDLVQGARSTPVKGAAADSVCSPSLPLPSPQALDAALRAALARRRGAAPLLLLLRRGSPQGPPEHGGAAVLLVNSAAPPQLLDAGACLRELRSAPQKGFPPPKSPLWRALRCALPQRAAVGGVAVACGDARRSLAALRFGAEMGGVPAPETHCEVDVRLTVREAAQRLCRAGPQPLPQGQQPAPAQRPRRCSGSGAWAAPQAAATPPRPHHAPPPPAPACSAAQRAAQPSGAAAAAEGAAAEEEAWAAILGGAASPRSPAACAGGGNPPLPRQVPPRPQLPSKRLPSPASGPRQQLDSSLDTSGQILGRATPPRGLSAATMGLSPPPMRLSGKALLRSASAGAAATRGLSPPRPGGSLRADPQPVVAQAHLKGLHEAALRMCGEGSAAAAAELTRAEERNTGLLYQLRHAEAALREADAARRDATARAELAERRAADAEARMKHLSRSEARRLRERVRRGARSPLRSRRGGSNASQATSLADDAAAARARAAELAQENAALRKRIAAGLEQSGLAEELRRCGAELSDLRAAAVAADAANAVLREQHAVLLRQHNETEEELRIACADRQRLSRALAGAGAAAPLLGDGSAAAAALERGPLADGWAAAAGAALIGLSRQLGEQLDSVSEHAAAAATRSALRSLAAAAADLAPGAAAAAAPGDAVTAPALERLGAASAEAAERAAAVGELCTAALRLRRAVAEAAPQGRR